MDLNTRVDTYKIKLGEHGIIQIETIYSFKEDNTVSISQKADDEKGYFHNTVTIPEELIYDIINILETAAEQLAELEEASELDEASEMDRASSIYIPSDDIGLHLS